MLTVTGMTVVLAGIAGASAIHHLNSSSEVKSGSASDSPLSLQARRVHALGRLEPAGRLLNISARSGNEGARVDRLLVREGDDVTAGELLAVLDNESLRQAVLAEAEARWHLTQIQLEQVKAGAKEGDIAAQKLRVELQAEQKRVAERELQRARDLHAKNVLTIEELDKKKWSVDQAELEYQRAQEQLKSLSEVRDIDVRVAERNVAVAEAAVHRAQVDLQNTKIQAPTAGRILKIHAFPGEKIGDTGLLEMGDVLHMEAVAEIFEADVVFLRPGLKAIVHVDCLEDPISGEISEIGHRVARKVVLTNDPVNDTDARVVEVRIRLSPDEVDRVVRLSNARIEVSIEIPAGSGP